MNTQVNASHYQFEKYLHKSRWESYWYQIKLISELKPKSILEAGVGMNFIKKYFSDKKINYKTLDVAKDLKPDIFGSIENIPLKRESFDLVCAFQVLEHLPSKKFVQCLNEMSRVSKKYILISLPYSNLFYYIKIKIPLIKTFYISLFIPRFWIKYKFEGEHYWEIGTKGYPLRKIKKIISRNFIIHKIIHPYENKYHIFFVLEKRKIN